MLGRRQPELGKRFGLCVSLLSSALVILIWGGFDTSVAGLQFVERYEWIPTLEIQYFVGVDGLGLLMVLLTAIVMPLVLLSAWRIDGDARLYFALLLLLQAGLYGTFTALNFFHWFIFWELSLIPAFFLVRIWGGSRRFEAALQFFVYTMVGSIGLLVAFMALFAASGTFDFMRLAELARSGELLGGMGTKLGWYDLPLKLVGLAIFALALLGFAVKVPMFPFHTWLPLTYAEAPTSTTMVLTGLMSKMGVYGLLRILLPIFPEQMRLVLTPLLWLAVFTIVLSAFAALAQKDLKRVLAYSSVNHLGYCLLGVFAAATLTDGDAVQMANEKSAILNGVMLQMFNHGITAAVLFYFLGLIERRSGGQRGIDDFGGLRRVAPIFCGLMGIALFASLGLPGLNGFVGEFLIFKGVFPLTGWAAALSTLGLLITAVFILGILQRVFHGPLNERWADFRDLTISERLIIAPCMGLIFLLGIYPQILLEMLNPAVLQLVITITY